MTLLMSTISRNMNPTRSYNDPFDNLRPEYSRLISAAVVNRTFRSTLLTNPVKSIDTGYCGEKFHFTREEKLKMQSIHAGSLEEFVTKLVELQKESPVEALVCYPKH